MSSFWLNVLIIVHVLVAGTFVVRSGVAVAGVTPGRAVRAPLNQP